MSTTRSTTRTRKTVVIGSTVRMLGAWPSGWRYPGAHSDPHDDPAAMIAFAQAAERARIDFLFFGDWLATAAEYEYSDPYLLARLEPFAAISYLSAVTEHIGLVATVNASYSEPYATARITASADLMSNGRSGLNVATGAELSSARNFGWNEIHPVDARIEAAGEVVDIVRGLWNSWADDAFVSDAERGRLIDPRGLGRLDYVGRHRASSGPLNVLRPPQGQLPIAIAAASDSTRELAALHADVALVTPRRFDDAVIAYTRARHRVAALGRDPEQYVQLAPILPIVGATRDDAWGVYDELVALIPMTDVATEFDNPDVPGDRSIRSLAGLLGVPLPGVLLDEVVPGRLAERFSPLGRALVQTVRERSGRTVGGGERRVTYRHLLAAQIVTAPVIVGSAVDVADHIESWFLGSAVDGFTVLSAFVGQQSQAFFDLVVPELERRGLRAPGYRGSTLREYLGLAPVDSRISVHP